MWFLTVAVRRAGLMTGNNRLTCSTIVCLPLQFVAIIGSI
jgi:hypothetical protein